MGPLSKSLEVRLVERVVPSPNLLWLPIKVSMGLTGLRTGARSPKLSEVEVGMEVEVAGEAEAEAEVEADGLEAAEVFRGSSFTMGLEGSDAKETGLELLPEPEMSIFGSPL